MSGMSSRCSCPPRRYAASRPRHHSRGASSSARARICRHDRPRAAGRGRLESLLFCSTGDLPTRSCRDGRCHDSLMRPRQAERTSEAGIERGDLHERATAGSAAAVGQLRPVEASTILGRATTRPREHLLRRSHRNALRSICGSRPYRRALMPDPSQQHRQMVTLLMAVVTRWRSDSSARSDVGGRRAMRAAGTQAAVLADRVGPSRPYPRLEASTRRSAARCSTVA